VAASSFLLEPGDLSRVPLAAVLIEALNERVTGSLLVEHDGGKSKVFLRDGIPVGAQSFTGFQPLGQIFLTRGRIDLAALSESLAGMAATGRPQGEVLVEIGAVTQAEVDAALTEQQEGYLARIASLAAGTFRFERSADVPRWTRGIRIRPLGAILGALEKPQAAALVASALQPAAGGPISLAPDYRRLAPAFGFGPAEIRLVERLATLTTLEEFFADPGVSPETARAILAALLLLGLAAIRPAGSVGAESIPGLVVDLADLAGVEVGTPAPLPVARGRTPAPARRSDPEEARRRRQRLLQRAMQNMGIGPLSRPPPPRPAAAEGGAAEPAAVPPGPADAQLRAAFAEAAANARSPDLFARLGIDRAATRDEVKQAYFALAKQFHPDRFLAPSLADLSGGVRDLFAALNDAYETLSDDRKRGELAARSRTGGPPTTPVKMDAAVLDFQKGEACLRTRDFARARGFFEAAVRAHPKPEYQAALAYALAFDPRSPVVSRAKELLAEALRDPSCDRAAYTAALLARSEGREEEAERLFRLALQANPGHMEAGREVRLIDARQRRR